MRTRCSMAAVLTTAFASLAAFAASAQSPSTLEDSVRDLSKCDASFFRLVGQSRAEMALLGPLVGNGSAMSFAVPDRRHPTRSRVMFERPVVVRGLNIVGFFDEQAEFDLGMSAYSWGYLIENRVENRESNGDPATTEKSVQKIVEKTIEKTAEAWKPLVWEAERLRHGDEVYVRSEVHSHDRPAAGWARVATQSGLPKPRTVERVLLIEPYDGETRFIRFGCSIQGHVVDPIVRELRPDLR